MIKFKPSTIEDCYELAPIMRQTDVEEVKASHGLSPLGALITSLQNSKYPQTILADDKVIGMRGVGHAGPVGYPWLLGSQGVVRHAKTLHATAKPWVDSYLDEYDILYNYVAENNRVAIRWLQRLGFVMIRRIPDHGVLRKPFYEFVRI